MWTRLKTSILTIQWGEIRSLFKLGDFIIIFISLIGLIFLYAFFWQKNIPIAVNISKQGQVISTLPLEKHQFISVKGPLGLSIIEITAQKARVFSDPSPRQYCVQQGWLTRAGEVALCLPNQVSIELIGRFSNEKEYDTLNY